MVAGDHAGDDVYLYSIVIKGKCSRYKFEKKCDDISNIQKILTDPLYIFRQYYFSILIKKISYISLYSLNYDMYYYFIFSKCKITSAHNHFFHKIIFVKKLILKKFHHNIKIKKNLIHNIKQTKKFAILLLFSSQLL